MVTGFLRGSLDGDLSEHDNAQVKKFIIDLDDAISKCHVPYDSLILYRGVENPTYWKNKNLYDEVTDLSYQSFTASLQVAKKYAGYNKKRNEEVIITTSLKKGDNALYLDALENEWLLPRNTTLKINDILEKTYEKRLIGTIHQIIYYIDKVN